MSDSRLETAISLIKEFLPLVEKYETALQIVSKDPRCPENLRRIAKKAIEFGEKVVDEEFEED
jgi:uncharacterized protein (UPF0147 family)